VYRGASWQNQKAHGPDARATTTVRKICAAATILTHPDRLEVLATLTTYE
jgi:hypothetical protein